jgi:hypothetical protein
MISIIYVDTYLLDAGVDNGRAVGIHFGKGRKKVDKKEPHIDETKFDASTVRQMGLQSIGVSGT